MWNALDTYDARPSERVGIVGVGGLGHLAIQFAAKMGCDVVVFSGTDSKKEEAMKLGASEFYATKGAKELKIPKPVDRLLVTTSAQPDWQLFLPILAPQAKVFPLSVSQGNFEFPYMPMIVNGITIQGTVVASRHVQNRMIEFAARHGIQPITQGFDMTVEGIEEAMSKLNEGNVRYRAVLYPKHE